MNETVRDARQRMHQIANPGITPTNAVQSKANRRPGNLDEVVQNMQ